MNYMNDAAVHNGANFNHLDPNAGAMDPSSFMANNASFDPSQFQNQQLQQRMQNGSMRNGSPGFANSPQYQTNQVIPSKRPREVSLGTSPRQTPGMLPNSRSQTPQQSQYSGFPQQHNAQPQQTPYSHLQNGSANASPSPIMMPNQLRAGAVPQRVSTASPHPFSPAGQNFAPQPSPSQSEHGRSDTPNNPYASNKGFAPGFSPSTFTPPTGRSSAPPPNSMVTPHMQQQPNMYSQQPGQPQPGQMPRPGQQNETQQLMYQMRLQQQLQQATLMNAQRGNMPPNVTTMGNPRMPGSNGMPVSMQQPQQIRAPNPEQFMKSLQSFMQSKGLPLDTNPQVGDRQIQLISLYLAVLQFGGHDRVTKGNLWGQVAQKLGFQEAHYPNSPMQLKSHYEQYLHLFERAWQENQNKVKAQQQQAAMARSIAGGQISPSKQMDQQSLHQQQFMQQQQQLLAQQAHQQQQRLQQQHAQSTPIKQIQQPINGFSTPQSHSQPAMAAPAHARNSLSSNMGSRNAGSPQDGVPFTIPSPVSASKAAGITMPSPQVVDMGSEASTYKPVDLPDHLEPKVRVLDTYGGMVLEPYARIAADLSRYRPDIPHVQDMGAIDIHALTMSLQCGIPTEVRMALDTLASLSVEARLQLDLRGCEDLVDTLIDCAGEQVEVLAENAAEVSDVMLVSSYEDIMRGCRQENEVLQDIAIFGSVEYNLDRAVERLLCITAILRNLAFYELNHEHLVDELVIKFLSVVIRYMGTRNMLLRSHQHTLDFMKDIVIFLSNVAHAIEIPGREQALCLLHFVLAFAPCPPPNVSGSDRVAFSSYDPSVHWYLPPALDTLAKLLARDEPNRTYYKTIFASDGVSSSPPYDLLTRTFGLSICVISDEKQDSKRGNLAPIVESRKPSLMQGMLAAEILANISPGFESGLAKSWLTSEDGFAQNLSRLIVSLCLDTGHAHRTQTGQPPRGVEDENLHRIVLGAIAVLQRLTEKCRDPEDPTSKVPVMSIPSKTLLLRALQTNNPKLQKVLKELCVYMGMDI